MEESLAFSKCRKGSNYTDRSVFNDRPLVQELTSMTASLRTGIGRWRTITRWLGSGKALPPTAHAHYLHVTRCVVRPLRAWLDLVRHRLEAPPTRQLVPGEPVTRDALIAVLRTAGARFAREYWLEHAALVTARDGPDLGPVPAEFLWPSSEVKAEVKSETRPKKRARRQ